MDKKMIALDVALKTADIIKEEMGIRVDAGLGIVKAGAEESPVMIDQMIKAGMSPDEIAENVAEQLRE